MFDGSFKIDAQSTIPRHAQVRALLQSLIQTGQLRPGDKIPAEVQLAAAFGVSKMTVNKALLALTQEGLLVRRVGSGTFVALKPVTLPGGTSAGSLPRIIVSSAEGVRDLFGSDYYGALYNGISEYLAVSQETPRAELRLSTPTGAYTPANWPLTIEGTRRFDTDAPTGWLILAPRDSNVPLVNTLWEQGTPCVVLGASWPTLETPWVDSGNYDSAVAAVQHLTALGHRRIALLYAEPETANTQDRIAGYRSALASETGAHDPVCEIAADKMWQLGNPVRSQLKTLLTAPEPATAIFAAGYYLALEAIAVAREIGLRIPDDVSIVGFDDPVGAQHTSPPLTTLRQPLVPMGARAAERLLHLMQTGSRTITRDRLLAEIVVRRSTAPYVPRSH